MDRYVLIPTTREINVNRALGESGDDLFAYAPETRAFAQSRGHLFVVGHTDQESGTVGYLVSLVAALAKREYFGSESPDAKAAFGQTLRKINEVVEEFSKSDDVKIDVGLFAVAGDELLVSRLGRFRILLARGGDIIDVLKDVGTFSKEHIEHKQFSSIISGPIQDKDRLMAYFPQKALASRERSIKQRLTEPSSQKVAAHLAAVGKRTKSFTCSALVIDLGRTLLPKDPSPPPESDTPSLAWTPRQASEAPVRARTVGTDSVGSSSPSDEGQEVPRIIASEFSHGSRSNPLMSVIRSVRRVRLGSVGRFGAVIVVAAIVIGSLWGFRSLFLTDEEAERIQGVITKAERSLGEAQASFESGDARSARATILAQLDALRTIERDSQDGQGLRDSFVELLDDVDAAVPGSITLSVAVTPDDGEPVLGVAASGSSSYWVVTALQDGSPGSILSVENRAIVTSDPISGSLPDLLVAADSDFIAVRRAERSLALHTDDAVIDTVLPTPDEILDAAWYGGNVYALTGNSILKVSDVDTSKPVTKQWLTDESDLASGAVAIAVDGDVWTLSRDGNLTRYYRGAQESSAELSFDASAGFHLLTSPDSTELLVTDTARKRVYVIAKETLSLSRTLTIDTDQSIRDIFLSPDRTTLLFITEDGKIWSLENPR